MKGEEYGNSERLQSPVSGLRVAQEGYARDYQVVSLGPEALPEEGTLSLFSRTGGG